MATGTAIDATLSMPQMLNEVSAAVGRGNLRWANDVAAAAIKRGMEHPYFFNARGLWAQNQGRYGEALADFQRSLALQPGEPALLDAMGLCFTQLNMPADAIAAFDAALQSNPDAVETRYHRGWARERAADRQGARLDYEQVLEVNAAHAGALAGLAAIAMKEGQSGQAKDFAQRALSLDPGEPTAIIAMAGAEISDRAFANAEQRLRAALNGPVAGSARAIMFGLLGDALDGRDRPAEAFEAFAAEKDTNRKLYANQIAAFGRVKQFAQDLSAYFQTASREDWKSDPAEPLDGAPREHVFVLGFLESGISTLDAALRDNVDGVCLAGRETLDEAAAEFLFAKDGLERLAHATDDTLAAARNTYWARVRSYGVEPAGKVFFDSQPMNTLNLPLIAKLFPAAKIVFAVRDPRDVVWDCFRRHFEINPITIEFMDLKEAAEFYSAVMTLADVCRKSLTLNVMELRHEGLAANLAALGDFTGLSLKSKPPASENAQTHSWRRYAKEMAPALAVLQAWVERFDYPPG